MAERCIHVIPVPEGYSVEEAWDEIRLFGMLTDGKRVEDDGTGGKWATVGPNDAPCDMCEADAARNAA